MERQVWKAGSKPFYATRRVDELDSTTEMGHHIIGPCLDNLRLYQHKS
jgi:hypothetical protein